MVFGTDEKKDSTAVRHPVVAGKFYPADARELRAEVESMLSRVTTEQLPVKPQGIIVPHAGYVFSGAIAAEAYHQVAGRDYSTVVVIAPSHHEFFHAVSVFPGAAYETPMGKIPLARDLIDRFFLDDFFEHSCAGHRAEHALEVQLPFLQVALPECRLIPLGIGDQQPYLCRKLSDVLARLIQAEPVLLVASSDLSHFHSYDTARKIDLHTADLIDHFDEENFFSEVQTEKAEACGAAAVYSVMLACRSISATHARVLKYQNSGDVIADRSHVVGYLSAILYGDA